MSNPVASIERNQERDVNLLFRTLAESIRNETQAIDHDGSVTEIDLTLIRQTITTGLNVIFGRFPGDPDAALRQVVVQGADRARLISLDEMSKRYRDALPQSAWDRLQIDAGVATVE